MQPRINIISRTTRLGGIKPTHRRATRLGASTPGSGDMCPTPTFGDPEVSVQDCDYNGCGDIIGIDQQGIAAGATVTIVVQAPFVFTPREFHFTGDANTFTIDGVNVSNGPDSQFGAGYAADYYALASFTNKTVSWPKFWNSPGLQIVVTNFGGVAADFQGLIKGVAAHMGR